MARPVGTTRQKIETIKPGGLAEFDLKTNKIDNIRSIVANVKRATCRDFCVTKESATCVVRRIDDREGGCSKRLPPKSALRTQIEALQAGESTTIDLSNRSLESVVRIINRVRHETGKQLSRRHDSRGQMVTVKCNGSRQHSLAGYDFANIEVGDVMFIPASTGLQQVQRASAWFCSAADHVHRIVESPYDGTIEVHRLPAAGINADIKQIVTYETRIAQQRVERVLRLEWDYQPGDPPNYDGTEHLAGQMHDILRILPPGQTVIISGVARAQLQEAAHRWAKARRLTAHVEPVVNGCRVTLTDATDKQR